MVSDFWSATPPFRGLADRVVADDVVELVEPPQVV
jgi:hypothetical protein